MQMHRPSSAAEDDRVGK